MITDALYEVPFLWIEVLFFPGTFRRQKGSVKRARLAVFSVVMASFVSAIFDILWYTVMSVQTKLGLILNLILYIGKNIVILVCLWLVLSLFLNFFAKFVGGGGKLKRLTFTMAFVCSAFQIALSFLFLLTAFTEREGALMSINFVFFLWLGLITTQAVEVEYRLRKIQAFISVLLSLGLIWFFYFLLFDITYLSPFLP